MYQLLTEHAIANVWCNPEQDNQLVIAAHKITRDEGVLNGFKMMNRYIGTPTNGVRYHVYQIGQLNPGVLGMLPRTPGWTNEQWFSVSTAINSCRLVANLYTSSGLEIPRFNAYYMYTNDRNFIIAIPESPTIPVNYATEQVYLRVYSNAYYASMPVDQLSSYLYTTGLTITNNQQIVDLQMLASSYASRSGHLYCYRNGMLIDALDMTTLSIGDVAELLYDSSVKRIVSYSVNDLPTFNSQLDNRYKYLLHHLSGANDTIDYQDDIDVYVCHHSTSDRYQGHYYHRNTPESHRMVTHRDYSIVVDYFQSIASSLQLRVNAAEPVDLADYRVLVVIRASGYHRPLVYDANRIFELYRLPDSDVLAAMVGIHATIPEWTASALEASAYTELMRVPYQDVTLDLVQRAYGYNAISKIIGDTPTHTHIQNSLPTAELSYGLHDGSTVYEYDIDGHMLGYQYHNGGTTYESNHPSTAMIQAIMGQGSHSPNVVWGLDQLLVPLHDSYRVYSLVNQVWTDITDTEHYTVVNGVLVWAGLADTELLMIRNDGSWLAYDLNIPTVGGNVFFTLSELTDRGDGLQHYILPVPLGELDVFLNGRCLIRDLDYIVVYPDVYITNHRYLVQPTGSSIQHIHVRYTGFDRPGASPDDYGWITHGVLSNNNRYDIRDDKVLHISVDGSVRHRDDVVMSEFHSGVAITHANNGQPYQIRDVVVPMHGLTDQDTYTLRDISVDIDRRIADYMTLRLPQPTRGPISAIPELYPVVSPFIARVIYELTSGHINESAIANASSDIAALALLGDYEYLLAYEPKHLNPDYVILRPHSLPATIPLTLLQYRFLIRVVRLYGANIELSPFITLTEV